MVFIGSRFCRLIAFTFLRDYVHQNRFVVNMFDIVKDGHKVLKIMPIDRPDIVKAELLEQRASRRHSACVFFRLTSHGAQRARQVAGDVFSQLAYSAVRAAADQSRQIGAHAPYRRCDGHVVVVEDDDKPFRRPEALFMASYAMPALIDPSPITAITLLSPPFRSRDTANPSAAEIDVAACAAPNGSNLLSARLVKPEQTPALAQGAYTVPAAGQNFVRVGLVTDVPDEDIRRGLKNMM